MPAASDSQSPSSAGESSLPRGPFSCKLLLRGIVVMCWPGRWYDSLRCLSWEQRISYCYEGESRERDKDVRVRGAFLDDADFCLARPFSLMLSLCSRFPTTTSTFPKTSYAHRREKEISQVAKRVDAECMRTPKLNPISKVSNLIKSNKRG